MKREYKTMLVYMAGGVAGMLMQFGPAAIVAALAGYVFSVWLVERVSTIK